MTRYAGILVEGVSTAAIETSIVLPELNVMFDVGRCLSRTAGVDHVFISHGHIDHCGAIALHAGLRSLNSAGPANYYSLPTIAPQLESVFSAMGALGEAPLPRRIAAVAPGDEIVLRRDLSLRTFATDHRVASQGCVLFERANKLLPQFAGLSGEEIGRRRAAGESLTVVVDTPLVAFSGDTRIEAIERCEWARRAKLLILEATYLANEHPVGKARERGHTHLSEILDRLAMFENEAILLTHFSARYTRSDIERILSERIPAPWRDRIHALL